MLIKNCNNIKEAEITLAINALNIKYAANGTGKSTIAKAIELSLNPKETLQSLTPFAPSDKKHRLKKSQASLA